MWSLCVAIGMFSTVQVKPGRVSNQEGLNVTSWVKEQICHNLLSVHLFLPARMLSSFGEKTCVPLSRMVKPEPEIAKIWSFHVVLIEECKRMMTTAS